MTRPTHLTKHHGLGNDFLVLLGAAVGGAMARALCDRRRGVGADGLIGVTPWGGGSDVTMDLYNADGSPAEMSGNGIRCVAQAVARSRGADVLDLSVDTPAGARSVQVRPGGSAVTASVRVDMGRARERPVVVPVEAPAIKGIGVDVGNPHLVLLVDDLDTVDPGVAGPGYGGDMNVEFVAPVEDGLAMKVWERGVGVTEACGTGACAAAFAAHQWGLVGGEGPVVVHMPGGEAVVEMGPTGMALTGPVVWVADIEVPWP